MVGWPGQRTLAFVVEMNDRACCAEIVKYLWVDLGNRVGVKTLSHVTGRDGGRVAGIVPAFEGHDHDRIA